ncbi:uncharacterized protein LOC135224815 [Macrobrachium nipponense]|uniref:uncharacterized protein LOC135224815 n=1 Tax=Macrobrachium nipponense TaxID=159736 RepID=UPI0030C7CC91
MQHHHRYLRYAGARELPSLSTHTAALGLERKQFCFCRQRERTSGALSPLGEKIILEEITQPYSFALFVSEIYLFEETEQSTTKDRRLGIASGVSVCSKTGEAKNGGRKMVSCREKIHRISCVTSVLMNNMEKATQT